MPRPDLFDVLTAWNANSVAALSILGAASLYLAGAHRVTRRFPSAGWPGRRSACFLSGLGALVIALLSPVDAYAEVFLWTHMVQHILITLMAAPLLVLGAPVTLTLRAAGSLVRRGLLRIVRSPPSRVISHPIVTWLLFAATLVGSHFSPLYQAALEDRSIHQLEHLLYLLAGLLFWFPVVGLDPGRWRLPHPVRVVYVLLAGPVNTGVALAIYSARDVLYPAYSSVARTWGPSPLADQRYGAALMWIVGDIILLSAVVLAAAAWMRHDRVLARRLDARLDAEQARPAGAGSG